MASNSTLQRALRVSAAAVVVLCVGGCVPLQSALHPAGTNATEVANLFWMMTISGAVIWAAVMAVVVYAVLGRNKPRSERFADRFILAGGVAFPTVTLALLLIFGLSLLPSWTGRDPPDLRIHVSAEQYWWRVSYELPGGGRVESANELHLPVDAVAEFVLTSADVIHSFWIPALGGKMDAIPGRTNLLRLEPTKPGIYRGVCAEFCGPSHALMAFPVEVHDAEGYEAWLAAEVLPARPEGSDAFISAGCGACHTVRGVVDSAAIGPDLTHLAKRSTIAAGTLPNTRAHLEAWIASPEHAKPDARMPPYASLPDADRTAIVDYLMGLT